MTNLFNYNRALFISGLLFTIHNIEEAVGTAYFVLPPDVSLPIELPGTVPMIWSVVLITLIGWCVILWAVRQPHVVRKRNILTFLVLLFLINALIPHIAASIALRKYTPALFTSVFIYLPYALFNLPKLYRQFEIKKQFYGVLFLGILATLAIVVALHRITTFIFS